MRFRKEETRLLHGDKFEYKLRWRGEKTGHRGVSEKVKIIDEASEASIFQNYGVQTGCG